jgi:glycosyltransferase involved in cell wall biosynthesis
MIKIHKNPMLAARLGKQGRERAEKELDWPVIGKKLQSVLEASGKK